MKWRFFLDGLWCFFGNAHHIILRGHAAQRNELAGPKKPFAYIMYVWGCCFSGTYVLQLVWSHGFHVFESNIRHENIRDFSSWIFIHLRWLERMLGLTILKAIWIKWDHGNLWCQKNWFCLICYILQHYYIIVIDPGVAFCSKNKKISKRKWCIQGHIVQEISSEYLKMASYFIWLDDSVVTSLFGKLLFQTWTFCHLWGCT